MSIPEVKCCINMPQKVWRSVWYTNCSRSEIGTDVGIYNGRERVRMSISLVDHATVVQFKIRGIMLMAWQGRK